MPDLKAEGDAQVEAGDVKGVVVPVVGREVPHPGQHVQPSQAQIVDGPAQLADGFDRLPEVNGGDANELIRETLHEVGDLVVGDDPAVGGGPGAEHGALDVARVHLGDEMLDGDALRERAGSGGPPEAGEHRIVEFPGARLGPGVDGGRGGLLCRQGSLFRRLPDGEALVGNAAGEAS